jgi:hypothetical protein
VELDRVTASEDETPVVGRFERASAVHGLCERMGIG